MSWISLIMGQIEPEHPELFALEFGKIAEYDFVYTQNEQFHLFPQCFLCNLYLKIF